MIKDFKKLTTDKQKEVLVRLINNMTAENADRNSNDVRWHIEELKQSLWEEDDN